MMPSGFVITFARSSRFHPSGYLAQSLSKLQPIRPLSIFEKEMKEKHPMVSELFGISEN